MSPAIHTEPRSDGREPPTLAGCTQQDGRWQLELELYQDFIADVTGVELVGVPSAREIKIIQSRLEGCIETYERKGDCTCREFERYEQIDSFETVHELARFFRVVVAVEIEHAEPAP